jgi:hypothetical protein
MSRTPKFALVRWGREKKHGQERLIRLAKVTGRDENGGLYCQTKPKAPDDVHVPFTDSVNLYEHDQVLKTWAAAPPVKEIRAELDRIARESHLRTVRRYHKLLETAVRRHTNAR